MSQLFLNWRCVSLLQSGSINQTKSVFEKKNEKNNERGLQDWHGSRFGIYPQTIKLNHIKLNHK